MDTSISMPNVDSNNFYTPQLKNALLFTDRGWPIFPLHYPSNGKCSCSNPNCSSPGKHPLTKNGFKDGSCDKDTVKSWWMRNPNANLGLVTGKDSGIVVLDIDPRHGGDQSLVELQKEFGQLPRTLSVKTGGDGAHYYFKHPGFPLTNKVNVRPGVDFRGDGGYIIAPPSVHASQKTYIWDDPLVEIAEMPNWLIDVLSQRNKSTVHKENTENSAIGEGGRKVTLLSIGGFLKNKGMDIDFIAKALESLNKETCNPPLPDNDLQDVLRSLKNYSEEPWPELQELPELASAPIMTVDMLPPVLRAFCFDISDRLQVPLEYTAGSAIVMFAGMIGRKIVACPKRFDNWEVVPNLWGCLIGSPGSMKTPAMSAVFKLLFKLAVKAREKHLQNLKSKEKEVSIANVEIEALKDALKTAVKNDKPEKIAECKEKLDKALRKFEELNNVHEIRYIVNDPTIEKLLSILEVNTQGILLYRDELGGWLETMQKSGREGDREFFLEAWNGDHLYSTDRIGRGTTFVDGLCLSVMGGLQKGKFASYAESLLKNSKNNDGLLQRFQILLYPEKRKKWRKVDRKPDQDAASKVEEILERIEQLPLPKKENDHVQRIYLQYSETAQEIANAWAERLEHRLDAEELSEIFESHISKYRSLMPSLALIFTIVEAFSNGNEFPSAMTKEAVELAIQWCDLLEAHARKAYGEVICQDETAARKLLEKIKDGTVKDYDRCREIYRRGWKGLTTADEFDSAVKVLKPHGWIRTEVITPSGGGRSEILRLHPKLRVAN